MVIQKVGIQANLNLLSKTPFTHTQGMLTAPLGARFAHSLNSARLGLCMGVMQLAIAPLLQLRPSRDEIASQKEAKSPAAGSTLRPENVVDLVYLAKMGAVGCFSGFMAGLFGIGGGAVVVPAIAYLTDHSHHTAIGTSLASMVLPSAVGSVTHYRLGNLIPSAAIPLAMGTAAGAAVGAQIVSTIPEEPLKWIFSAFMLFLGSKAVIKAI
ncbi:hypothetical protein DIPPA_11291 [Diplonema papillatum]|nr:hypothetical protein DIPPA_11291 [Diplonema papillatum]